MLGPEIQRKVIELGLRIFPLEGKKPERGFKWKEQAACQPVSSPSYGICCDDKIAVIDCDTREAAVSWYNSRVRTPWMVKTPRGGVHFVYSGETRNAQRIDGPIDVRGNGGYIVGVGSVVRGRVYELVGTITLDLPPFDPSWLPCRTAVEQPVTGSVPELRLRARLYIARIFSISGEGGDKALFRAACALVQRFGLSEGEALEELRVWNQTNARPPWGDDRLRYKIAQALRLRIGNGTCVV